MANAVTQYLSGKLEKRQIEGNKRNLFLVEPGVDFYSNDYLGISTNNVLAGDVHNGSYGSTGSRLLSGNSIEAIKMEEYLAEFHQEESALIFNSGYDANIGLISSIADRHTIILYDELCHASIIDGTRMSFAKASYKFEHNNVSDLEEKLSKIENNTPIIIIVESVYSMEGDIAPLLDLINISNKYNAALVVDEAHATGVFGKYGVGCVQELNLQGKIFARIHTFGKAIGCHGAVILGSVMLKNYLINFSRSFIYTTALPASAINMAKEAYEWLKKNEELRLYLHELISYFKQKIISSKFSSSWISSSSCIQSLQLHSNEKVRLLKKILAEEKINVAAIMHPTVPIGTERIRICIHAFNTKNEIDNLFHTIERCLQKNESQ